MACVLQDYINIELDSNRNQLIRVRSARPPLCAAVRVIAVATSRIASWRLKKGHDVLLFLARMEMSVVC